MGTRNATEYGRELTESLIKDLAKVIPDLLVVSGLAYGIDICAHRNALYNRLPTVAVLAHGLDRIYPSCHRNTAVEMLESGGLLTDFPSGTEPDRQISSGGTGLSPESRIVRSWLNRQKKEALW